jgi:hypothetical protein
MTSPVSSLDQVTAEVMKRLYLTRIPCIFETLDQLYWDADRGKPRKGIVDGRKVKPGDLVHRLPIRIRQLEKTYDLFSLTANQLLELLGDEFQIRSKNARKRVTRSRIQGCLSRDPDKKNQNKFLAVDH